MNPLKKKIDKQVILDELSKKKEHLYEKYSITKIGLFGSYCRGEENNKSDIDILIDFNKTPNIFIFMEIEEYLSDLLGKKVDLVTNDALKPVIGNFIRKEVIYI
jgi:predicted nucleotidyltransferase